MGSIDDVIACTAYNGRLFCVISVAYFKTSKNKYIRPFPKFKDK